MTNAISRRVRMAAMGALTLGIAMAAENPAAGQPQPQSIVPAGAILCRVLDAKSAPRLKIALAVFHQAHQADGERLGELLRSRDGAVAKFQTPDGVWHSATVLRLGSCFGRGLLVFPAKEATLTRKEEIWLQVPTYKGSLDARNP